MKTKMTVVTTLALLGVLSMAFSSIMSARGATFVQGVLTTVPLWTWSDATNVGTVTVAVEGENLVVTLETTSGWLMSDTHLYADTTWPGWAFPFPLELFIGHEGLGGVATDTFVVSLMGLGVECNDLLYISAHAHVTTDPMERDAWGQENPFIVGWNKYFSVTIPCEEKPAGKSPGWWKHQFLAHIEGKGNPQLSWSTLVDLTAMIDAYYGLPPPPFFGYPLPPVSSLDYDMDGDFDTTDAYLIFTDTAWNHLWTPLANWYNWAYGLGPY
jgi:hypothetical protein